MKATNEVRPKMTSWIKINANRLRQREVKVLIWYSKYRFQILGEHVQFSPLDIKKMYKLYFDVLIKEFFRKK